jgi:hypothetical protein
MINKPDEYRIPQAPKLLDLYEEANGKPATTVQQPATIGYDRVVQ